MQGLFWRISPFFLTRYRRGTLLCIGVKPRRRAYLHRREETQHLSCGNISVPSSGKCVFIQERTYCKRFCPRFSMWHSTISQVMGPLLISSNIKDKGTPFQDSMKKPLQRTQSKNAFSCFFLHKRKCVLSAKVNAVYRLTYFSIVWV